MKKKKKNRICQLPARDRTPDPIFPRDLARAIVARTRVRDAGRVPVNVGSQLFRDPRVMQMHAVITRGDLVGKKNQPKNQATNFTTTSVCVCAAITRSRPTFVGSLRRAISHLSNVIWEWDATFGRFRRSSFVSFFFAIRKINLIDAFRVCKAARRSEETRECPEEQPVMSQVAGP